MDLANYEPENLPSERAAVFILPTYTGGTPLPATQPFHDWLKENSDERGGNTLRSTSAAVFGLGNREYQAYNAVGRETFRQLYQVAPCSQQMGATLLCTLGDGDESGDQGLMFSRWCDLLLAALSQLRRGGRINPVSGVDDVSDDEAAEPLLDLEELGPQMKPSSEKPEFGKPMLSGSCHH